MNKKCDFGGWATKNNIPCSDGRTIRHGAFKECDGVKVPLVWNHRHSEASNVLGYGVLEHRDEGVYVYGTFNDTQSGRDAKELVKHGDVTSLSIYANRLKQVGSDVLHGAIREVSLVLAGANAGAKIDFVLAHTDDGDYDDQEAYIFTDAGLDLAHSETEPEQKTEIEHAEEEKPMPDTKKDLTIGDILDTMNEQQKNALYAIIGELVDDDNEGDGEVKHNLFEDAGVSGVDYLSHAELMAVLDDAPRCGSLREAALQHGIEDIEYLFPEAKNLTDAPEFIKRQTGWVSKVMNGVHRTPFSRIKTTFADITEDEARALGYIKGNLKKEEFFGLIKRVTEPQTIYKKQKLDRDDVLDITDFDVINWLKAEMRGMLEEEIARAILIGDGRLASSDDKIKEDKIRPIYSDEALFTKRAKMTVAASDPDENAVARNFIRTAVKGRVGFRGTGTPTLFTTESVLSDLMLMEDGMGRVIYDTVDKVATALRVKEIVTVDVMEGVTRVDGGTTLALMGIIVNLDDYNVGADKGGAVNMFDDFDIDYNAQKYLIETRCSGTLTKPFSALVVEAEA